MKEEGEAFLGQAFPLAEGVHGGSGGFSAQFPLVEELGRQKQQGLMGTVVVDQLSHLPQKNMLIVQTLTKLVKNKRCKIREHKALLHFLTDLRNANQTLDFSIHCTDQLWVVSPVVFGVQRVGHQSLQQRHPQSEVNSLLRLHYRAQLTGVSS